MLRLDLPPRPALTRRPLPDRLRILLASRAPFFGGAEQAGERLVRALAGAGHQVLVVCGQEGLMADRLARAGIEVHVSPLPNSNKWSAWKYAMARSALRRLIRRFDPHIVHANDLPTHQILSDAARGLAAARLCHHRFPYRPQAVQWFNKHGADRHVFVSRAFMEQMCGRCATLAVAPRAVVHDGIELPDLPTDTDRLAARAELGLPADRRLFLFTGQVIPRKGIADLLDAWALLPLHLRRRAELVIVGDDLAGDGAYRLAMEQRAARHGLPVTFTGFRDDVQRWVCAADVVVLPSHDEPLGLTVMEAMAQGRPAIGTRVGGIPEMILHQQTGLLVRPADPADLAAALARLIDQPDLGPRLGRQARLRCARHFSIQAHLQQMLIQYARLLNNDDANRRCA